MRRDLEHVELPLWQQPIARRKHGGGQTPTRESRADHGAKLKTNLAAVEETFDSSRRDPPAGIDPKFVFTVRLHSDGQITDRELLAMGLRLVAREPNKLLVVFPDQGTLDELRRRIDEYAKYDKAHYVNVGVIEEIEALQPEDKIGPRLKSHPLEQDEIDLLDVSLWHSGNVAECRCWINALSTLMDPTKHRVTDSWIGNDLCLLRMKVDREILDTILQVDFVRSVERRAQPVFEFADVTSQQQSDIEIDPAPVPLVELTGIVVVDSGVMQGHPLLAPVIGDAQSFVADDDRAEDVDETAGGHGTAVAGIAAYGDIGAGIRSGRFVPDAAIFSGRVLTANLEYDPERLLEHQLDDLVTYFVNTYPNVRIVNLSIGNLNEVFDGGRQSRLAAAIDELAYRFREREVMFTVATGNYIAPDGEEAADGYPDYLKEDEARLVEPATSAIALTVGGVAYGPGTDPQVLRRDGVETLVAQTRGWPSPFTRAGLGVDKAVKPDIVDFAGDIRFERGRSISFPPQHAGLPSTSKSFAPPEGRLFRTVAGTSFAAPRVANLAARLYREFPGASSNLIRALIAASARVPADRPPELSGPEHELEVLRIYGYGIPDYDRARFSSEQEVLLLAEEEIELDSFQLFTLPGVPKEFMSIQGEREITVTLAFDPPTRQTRGDSYLGVRMYAHLFRNVSPDDLMKRLKAMTAEEREMLGKDSVSLSKMPSSQRVQLEPGVNVLRSGTLQRGSARVRGSNWRYDGNDMVLAVVCQGVWAPVEVDRQRFAVVVSVAHSDPTVQLHAHIRQRAQVWQQARVRV